MKVAQRGARTFRKIFARQEAHALHSENDPQGWQQQAPRQRPSRYALRFIATLNSGVCDQAKDECKQENVCGDVKIEIENGMDRVSGNRTKRSHVQRHRVAEEKGGNGHAFRTKTLKAFPTAATMESKEDKKAERTEHAVLGQKMKIIIMHFHRIALHAIGAELAAIKKISACACAHEGLDFPLLERGRAPAMESPTLRGHRRRHLSFLWPPIPHRSHAARSGGSA